MRFHRAGDKGAARRALGEALKLSPDHPDALNMLANLDGEDGELNTAEGRVIRALEVRPDFPPYLSTLSRIQAAGGRTREAIKSLRKALDVAPAADMFIGLGVLLLSDGQADNASEAFEQALAREPDNTPARINLGIARFNAGSPREAADHFAQVLKRVPNAAGVAQKLGLAWQACGEHQRAVRAFEDALRAGEESPALRTVLGISYTASGSYKEAMRSFDEALKRDPEFADALAGKAELLEWQGEFQQGLSLLEQCVAEKTVEPAILTVYARLLRRAGQAAEGVAVLQPLVTSDRLSGAPLRQARFTLGDLNDELGHYEEAFGWYKLAHDFRPNRFSAAAHEEFIRNLKARFSAENFRQLQNSGNQSEQPVFIIGMPRSGTSLVEQILSAHPDVYAAGERASVGRIVQRLAPVPDPSAAELARYADEYLNELSEVSRDALRITDKMPLNFLYVGWIMQLFPRARIVWCRRDPRDTGLSCYATNFIDPALAFSDRLEDIALYSNSCNELMTHWQGVIDPPLIEMQYELLVSDPEAFVREMLESLGLAWHPACLSFHTSKRVVKTSSHAQVREPIYSRAVGRWKNYAANLQPLIANLEHND